MVFTLQPQNFSEKIVYSETRRRLLDDKQLWSNIFEAFKADEELTEITNYLVSGQYLQQFLLNLASENAAEIIKANTSYQTIIFKVILQNPRAVNLIENTTKQANNVLLLLTDLQALITENLVKIMQAHTAHQFDDVL